MKLRNLLMLVLLVSLTTACGSRRDQKGTIGRIGRDGRGAIDADDKLSLGTAGDITRGSYDQGTFQYHVEALISNLKNDDGTRVAPCSVSGDPGQNTGLRVWGNVEGASARVRPNGSGSQQSIKEGTAELRISILDSCVGQTDEKGNKLTEIPIFISNKSDGFGAQGTIAGNQADITFRDKMGFIRLVGNFNQNLFQGVVYYDNVAYWDGYKPGAAGYLGVFAIPTCDFFKCE